MGFSQRLELRQSQTLVMTPQLQQAIKMLQLSNLELGAFVQAEIEQNPLLERGEREADEGASPETEPQAESEIDGLAATVGDALIDGGGPEAAEHWRAASGEEGDGTIDIGGDPGGESQLWHSRNPAMHSGEVPGIDQAAARPRTLREHLMEQIGADLPDQADRIIALYLLDQLDDAGYLQGGLDGAAERLGCAPRRIEQVLARVQEFDPPGVFARSLAECLALQLHDRNRLDPAMQRLLDNLPLLAARNVGALMRLCGVDAEDLAEMVAEIKSLDPRPGLAFDPPLAQPVVPDIIMRAQSDGGWAVELNTDTLPRVLVNNRYHARVSRAARNKAEREYLTERLQAANWLVKSLHQRAVTILKVASEIVEQQDGFFRAGVQALRPLILRDIADAIGMHESTVSRVTTNKYIATPRGLFELKYFFTSSIAASRGGDAHSAEAVRFRIRNLIDSEPSNSTLSDEQIVELLQQDGVDIARRTVAKYREAMRIPSSVQRRREKMLAL
ncbi:MAG: RNA polymerase factor sigma-54 [Alphaproteobacteria bacterium]|nr:RNA polymerase factor sigma-54 [Alphaproteobacteria bacterium]MBV9152615.1 RNA polymerase factor sigma-54 [Alphaproteobacteria bacterium]